MSKPGSKDSASLALMSASMSGASGSERWLEVTGDRDSLTVSRGVTATGLQGGPPAGLLLLRLLRVPPEVWRAGVEAARDEGA
eukprot:8209857-Alexandrium_andersonii.AAC.1